MDGELWYVVIDGGGVAYAQASEVALASMLRNAGNFNLSFREEGRFSFVAGPDDIAELREAGLLPPE